MKTCTKCKIEKELKEFSNNRWMKDGKNLWCKICVKIKNKNLYQNNKDRIIESTKKYYKQHIYKCRKRNREAYLSMMINKPWMSSYRHAKERCNNPNCEKYPRYGGRGIKFLLTKEEVKKLWIRDKGWLLNRFSIDRKDNDGNYEYKNCQFIELVDNCKKQKVDRG